MGILLCEQKFCDVWIRNESVWAEIGQILHTDTHPHTHTTAAKLVVRVTQPGKRQVFVVIRQCVYVIFYIKHHVALPLIITAPRMRLVQST